MKKARLQKDSIYLIKKSRRTSFLKYQLGNFGEVSFNDTFIRNFEGLGFSPQEKRRLTQQQRMFLAKFKNINQEGLKNYSRDLLNKLGQIDTKGIQIEAKEFGVYICLAAIFSGKLDSEHEIKFLFQSAPLALFPLKLIKCHEALNYFEVTYSDNSENWLDQYHSLISFPDFLKVA